MEEFQIAPAVENHHGGGSSFLSLLNRKQPPATPINCQYHLFPLFNIHLIVMTEPSAAEEEPATSNTAGGEGAAASSTPSQQQTATTTVSSDTAAAGTTNPASESASSSAGGGGEDGKGSVPPPEASSSSRKSPVPALPTTTTASTKAPAQPTTAPPAPNTVIPPPTLNVYKKIAVIRNVNDTLRYSDATTGTIKSVSIQELGEEILHTTTASASASGGTPQASNKEATAASSGVPTPSSSSVVDDDKKQPPKLTTNNIKKQDIPVPKIETNSSYSKDIPASYQIANSYVRYHRYAEDEYYDIFEYVADEEDELWLNNNTKFGGASAVVVSSSIVSEEEKEVEHPATTTTTTTTAEPTTDKAETNNEPGTGTEGAATNKEDGKEDEITTGTAKVENSNDNKVDAAGAGMETAATTAGGGDKQPKQAVAETKATTAVAVTEKQPPPPPKQPRKQQLSLEILEQIFDLLEKATGFDVIITMRQAETLILTNIPNLITMFPLKAPRGSATTTVLLKHVLSDIYNYWVQKRSKLKRPLLRRFWPVTSTDDTNPHLVFRPREKEKYKLRKKRQNDRDAYVKLKQLRQDFDNLRVTLELVKRREELRRLSIQTEMELFQHRLHDIVDTSGRPRISNNSTKKSEMKRCWELPLHFDNITGTGSGNNRKAKRMRSSPTTTTSDSATAAAADGATAGSATTSPAAGSGGDTVSDAAATAAAAVACGGTTITTSPSSSVPSPDHHQQQQLSPTSQQQLSKKINIAGRNHGEPAPLFVHPLRTRESYITSWEDGGGATPCIPSYVDSNEVHAYQFRHRPRIGRGGRVCIDRMPMMMNSSTAFAGNNNNGNKKDDDTKEDVTTTIPPPITVLRAGKPMPQAPKVKERLLDLLPKPIIDKVAISRKLQAWSIEPSPPVTNTYSSNRSLQSQLPLAAAGGGGSYQQGDDDEDNNNGEEVIVKVKDWLETDDQLWGEERFAIGPI